MKAYISCTSHYAPKKTLTNLDLEKIIDTSDEWIKTRTGIEKRHIIGKNTNGIKYRINNLFINRNSMFHLSLLYVVHLTAMLFNLLKL